MSAQLQYLPVLGHMAPTVTFKGLSVRLKSEPVDEKVKTLNAITAFCERRYLNAPYVMGAEFNYELVAAVAVKYLRSLPDYEPTQDEPALKPTITSHEKINHWISKVTKTTHIDLCRSYATYRKHFVNASSLVPADADEDFEGLERPQRLQWGDTERDTKQASFHNVKQSDWHKIKRQLDANHPLPESCRAWAYVIPIKSRQNLVLEPLNSSLKASGASAPYCKGRQYRMWPAEGLAIVGQAMRKLTVEERVLIRKGWEDAEYDPDFEKILNRLVKLSAPKVQAGIKWPIKQLRRIVDDAGGLANLWDEYAGWNYNPFLLAELSYSPSHAIPTVEVSEPAKNDFQLFFPSAGDEKPSSTHYRYQGADVEILEDGTSNLRLVRYVCGERAPVWVPADELIAPKKKVNKRAHQVANMYRCSERGCSCRPVSKYPAVNPPYCGPAPQNDRECWLVAVGHQADWKRPEYLGRK